MSTIKQKQFENAVDKVFHQKVQDFIAIKRDLKKMDVEKIPQDEQYRIINRTQNLHGVEFIVQVYKEIRKQNGTEYDKLD